ncbi:MAG: DUF5106 domain-containing protein [Rikenellaceae bacterium]
MKFRVLLLTFAIMMVGCGGDNSSKSKGSSGQATSTAAAKKQAFMPPMIPAHIADPQAKLDYMVDHFWDNYSFSDSLLLSDMQVTGEAFTTYAELLRMVPAARVEQSVTALLSTSFDADSLSFATFTTLFENYFHNPNSPYMNEETYIPALRYIIGNEKIEPINKLRAQAQLTMALKNRVGHKAADFEYMLRSGKSGKMHDIEAEYTILFFNNPDCHDCTRVKEFFVGSAQLNALQQQGELKILSIYPDSTIELWRETQYPDMMINSYDKGQVISQNDLYDLKAIPTLYLLDSEKRVLLKDAPIEMIEAYLLQQHRQ